MKKYSCYTSRADHVLSDYLQKVCLILFLMAVPFALQANYVSVDKNAEKKALISNTNATYSDFLWNAIGVKANKVSSKISSSKVVVGGDFSLDLAASAPLQYNHTTGGGAWQDGTIGRNEDVVESLEGGDFTCGDIVTFFTKIDVASGAVGSQSIEIDYSFLAYSTGQPGVALYLPVGEYLTNDPTAPGYEADAGYTGDGDETISISEAFHLEGCQGPGCTPTLFVKPAETVGSVTVGGLEAGESVIVRIDVVIHCKPGSSPTGNLQGAITGARALGFSGRDASISVGQQTVPFKNVNLITFPTCDISPDGPVCGGATTTHTATSDVADASYLWSITGNGSIVGAAMDGTKTVDATGGALSTSVDVTAEASGSYTLSVAISKSGFGTSNCSQIVTINAVTAGVIDGGGTGCSPFDAPAFTETTAASGSGTLTYRWESSTTSASTGFSPIAMATGTTYDPGAVSVQTWYRRVAISTLNSVPCEATSNVLTVVPNAVTAGVIDGGGTGCSPFDAPAFTETTAASGSGTLTYRWESSTTSASTGFSPIAMATGATYDPGAVSVQTWYRRVAISTLNSVPCEATSNVLTVVPVPCDHNIFTTGASCSDFTSQNSAFMLDDLCVSVDGSGKVTNAYDPGAFFYYAKFVAPAGTPNNSTVVFTVIQNAPSGFYEFTTDATQVKAWSGTCGRLNRVTVSGSSTEPVFTVNGISAGEVVILSVKYDPKSIIGSEPSGAAPYNYTFETVYSVNGGPSTSLFDSGGTLEAEVCQGSVSATSSSSSLQSIDKAEAGELRAYPTPFSDKATIEFTTAVDENYTVRLYDMRGALIKELKSGAAKAGVMNQVEVDGRNLPEGLYLGRVVSDSGSQTVKLLLKR